MPRRQTLQLLKQTPVAVIADSLLTHEDKHNGTAVAKQSEIKMQSKEAVASENLDANAIRCGS